MFSIDRLRALSAVAAHGSIARAARALHVTPSGVSQQLAKLERESGHQLLEPDGRSIRLTHAGRVLTAHADLVLAQLTTAATDLADLHEEILGPLRLGGVGSAIRSLLPGTLAALTREHPRLVPTLCDGEAVDMLPVLLAGDLDLLVIESWSNRPITLPAGIAFRTLVREGARVALAADHPLAANDSVDLAELKDEVWASCGPGTEPREALLQALRVRGVEPEIRYTVAEYTTQLALVEAGLTAALIPAMAYRPAPAGVRFVDCAPALEREVLAAWRAGSQSATIRACLAALSSHVLCC
ncbi:LysR family transcriptional regulator [Streptomyces sp. N2-109]|uniref:LysR family transcriptional regulator n=1 Tax=Streptomyces gossypii TaxID=2883101 RepID=A0ABT2K0Z6_9ACTN|nr:LysR family transcriptional regulator [Streptomyces gossypii]MCT2593583.1 LysR family transcriptional regulator [Streptomyces gossypii]